MIKKMPILDQYFVTNFKNHEKNKKELLDLISKYDKNKIVTNNENIFNSNWNNQTRNIQENEWAELFLLKFKKEIIEAYKNIGYSNLIVHNLWFQQYAYGSYHGWHSHPECNFSNVYYLNLPEGGKTTEFLLFGNNNYFAEANEGDLMIFPSHIPHRVAENKTKELRTVIVFNTSVSI